MISYKPSIVTISVTLYRFWDMARYRSKIAHSYLHKVNIYTQPSVGLEIPSATICNVYNPFTVWHSCKWCSLLSLQYWAWLNSMHESYRVINCKNWPAYNHGKGDIHSSKMVNITLVGLIIVCYTRPYRQSHNFVTKMTIHFMSYCKRKWHLHPFHHCALAVLSCTLTLA